MERGFLVRQGQPNCVGHTRRPHEKEGGDQDTIWPVTVSDNDTVCHHGGLPGKRQATAKFKPWIRRRNPPVATRTTRPYTSCARALP